MNALNAINGVCITELLQSKHGETLIEQHTIIFNIA